MIGKPENFWLNKRKKLRSIRVVAVYRNAAFFKRSIVCDKGFCNLLTLQKTAMLNGLKDVRSDSTP